jgi:hypothetical protein
MNKGLNSLEKKIKKIGSPNTIQKKSSLSNYMKKIEANKGKFISLGFQNSNQSNDDILKELKKLNRTQRELLNSRDRQYNSLNKTLDYNYLGAYKKRI